MMHKFRFGRALALPLVFGLMLGMAASEALAKKGGLDDSTRDDDKGRSNSSSTSGSSNSGGSSGGSGSGGGAAQSGGRDGYDRVTSTETPSVSDALEQAIEQKYESSLDGRLRNDRDRGDRFR